MIHKIASHRFLLGQNVSQDEAMLKYSILFEICNTALKESPNLGTLRLARVRHTAISMDSVLRIHTRLPYRSQVLLSTPLYSMANIVFRSTLCAKQIYFVLCNAHAKQRYPRSNNHFCTACWPANQEASIFLPEDDTHT